jgi:hypothetical protein
MTSLFDLEQFANEAETHRWGDHFSPPGASNLLGALQVDADITGVRCLGFPPLTLGSGATPRLLVGGRYPAAEVPIEYRWRPDRVERRASFEGIEFASVTAMPPGRRAVLVALRATNRAGARRTIRLRLRLGGRPRSSDLPEAEGITAGVFVPEETGELSFDRTRGALVSRSPDGRAALLQGALPSPAQVEGRCFDYQVRLAPGKTWELRYVCVLEETLSAARRDYDHLLSNFDQALAAATKLWEEEISAAFTPGNDRFSGHLPLLETKNRALERLYLTGTIGALFCKRVSPASKVGPTYVTLMPCFWQSAIFLWDLSLGASFFALLDPHALRRLLEAWMRRPLDRCLAIDYLTGKPRGPWYAANHTALVEMADSYLRWSGDFAWLKKRIAGRPVLDHLEREATRWRSLDKHGHGLADCGGVLNLLEAVSTYTHEVAGFNAAWVKALRSVAALRALIGDRARARALEAEAAGLLKNVKKLYLRGKGFWRCRQPGGQLREVRHGYDFVAVLRAIAGDLAPSTRQEMVRFFQEELQTPHWMRALSLQDEDAGSSWRPDVQWSGAYGGFPAVAAQALCRAGEGEIALDWLEGLALTARQGPFGQAHWVEDLHSTAAGGARKVSSLLMTDWCSVSNACYPAMVIEDLFGAEATLREGIRPARRPSLLGRKDRLVDLAYQGRRFTIEGERLPT